MRHSRYRSPDHAILLEERLPLDTVCTVLVRQSSAKQAELHVNSAEVNPKDLMREAERQGFLRDRIRVLDWDMGIGAYNTTIEDRPALRHWLTELLPRGESRVVLVSQEDRLFRDRTEIQVNRFIEQVARRSGWVICGIGNARIYNFRREMDRELFRMACKYGRQYVEYHIKGRLHPAIQRAAMAGRYAGGPISWGYVVDYNAQSRTYKHFIPYEPHARLVVDHVFRVFEHLPIPSVVEVARHWGREGLVWPFFGPEVDARRVHLIEANCRRNETLGGYDFHFRQAHNILTDVAYLGWRARQGQVAWDDERQAPRICHQPLVEQDLFWRCYDHLLDERPSWAPPRKTMRVVPDFRPRQPRRRHADTVPFLVPGRVTCAVHGSPLGAIIYPEQKAFLRCRGNDRLRMPGESCSAVLAATVERALCDAFVEQLELDEEDIRNLAMLAERRERQDAAERPARLGQELAERKQRLARAKRMAMNAGDENLADEFLAEAREITREITDLEAQLASACAPATVSAHAWSKAEWAATLAQRIRSTFIEWPRPAQARVLLLALEGAIVGRIDRRTLGFFIRWHGGLVSRRELSSRVGLLVTWTEEEHAALRAHYAALDWDALQRMLPGRTVEAIKREAARLGLHRPRTGHSSVVPLVIALPEPSNTMGAYGFPFSQAAQGVVGLGGSMGSMALTPLWTAGPQSLVTAALAGGVRRQSTRNCSCARYPIPRLSRLTTSRGLVI